MNIGIQKRFFKLSKAAILAYSIAVTILLCGNISEVYADSGNCQVSASWTDQSGQPLTSFTVNVVSTCTSNSTATCTTYHALATFTNCQNDPVFLRLYGPTYGTMLGTVVGLGSPISSSSAYEQRFADFTVSQTGDWYFNAFAQSASAIEGDAPHITAVAAPTSGNPPANTTQTTPTDQTQTTQPNNAQTTAAAPASTAVTSPSDHLYNPIPKQTSLTVLLVNIMKGFLAVAATWAVVFIVIGGFRMIISSGNEEAVATAKKTILWAVLGLAIALLSFVIIIIVQNIIGVEVQAPTTTFINSRTYEI